MIVLHAFSFVASIVGGWVIGGWVGRAIGSAIFGGRK